MPDRPRRTHPPTPVVESASDQAARARLRYRRKANVVTVIACLLAAAAAIALAVWLPSLAP